MMKKKELIKQWIEQGAKYEGFWAFETPKKSDLPKDDSWSQHPIDLYASMK